MIKVAVGIILQRSAPDFTRVLLCQRRNTSRYPLKWEFPGGKVEEHEGVEQCLQRELFEELGIRAEIGKLFHRQHYEYPDSGTFDVFYHLVLAFDGTIENRVFAAFKWVPIRELSQFDILEGNKDVVAKLLTAYENVESEKS